MTQGVLLSVGRGMGLYLYIAEVVLERIPRKLFLCSYDMHMLTLYVDDSI